MHVTVAPPVAEDRAQWEALYYGYAEFYQVPMNQAILDNNWGWIFDENFPFYALLAKTDDGKAVGLMHFREMPSPLRGRMVGFLDDLFVPPEHRGQGIVEALFKGLDQACADKDLPIIRWITAENNYRGRAVYDRIGEKTHWQTYQMSIGSQS